MTGLGVSSGTIALVRSLPRLAGLPPVALSLLLAACAFGAGKEEAKPGTLEGVVTLGPLRPGPIRPGMSGGTRPYEAKFRIVALGADGKPSGEAKEVRSDEKGLFRIALPPGRYRIEPQPALDGGMASAHPREVVVESEKTLRVEIQYDSGMR